MYYHLQPNLLHIMDQAAVLEDATKMEFYDVITSDIKDIWDNAYFMETMSMCQDSLLSKDEDWCSLPSMRNKSPVSVVIRDRLMTDAALGGPKPIKTEHSYSLLASSPPRSPDTPSDNSNASNNDSNVVCQDAVISSSHQEETHRAIPLRRTRITDLLEECFPVFSESDAPCAMPKIVMKEEIDIEDCTIKGEPISAPNSPNAPTSPSSSLVNDNSNSIITIEPHTLHFSKSQGMQSDSEMDEDDEEMYQNIDFDVSCLEAEQECQSNDGVRQLPPTPPSSASSDSETSASCSPERRDSQTSSHVQSLKGLLTPRLYVTNTSHTHTTRRPINTPLISCQPKGSTGVLILTEEEKRTLLAEGYPIPTKLPLSKSEEKSLKKIRRKIKNKISAQESRRKKKEYMDNLERRVTILTNENSSYKDRLSSLEAANRELVKELNRLQTMLKDKSS